MSPQENNLGQLIIAGFEGTRVDDAVRSLLSRVRPAGVILFAKNMQSPHQVKQLTANLQADARELGIFPLLVGVDHEGGRVVRMGEPLSTFPGNLALGATESPALAEKQAQAMAQELLALGINWNYAPCVDVNSNPANPIIGVRAFGDAPPKVAEFGVAMIRGFQSQGLLTCAKHFPGHGDTEVDSHLGLPVVARPEASLQEVELPPFRAAVEAGVASIMTAHVVFPALEEKRPATISKKIITGLLRDEMGYDGLVLTDALEMAGLADSIGMRAGVVESFKAGVDVMLACGSTSAEENVLESLRGALQAGHISAARVRQSVERVKRVKERYLSPQKEYDLSILGTQEHIQLEDTIAQKSITALKGGPTEFALSDKRTAVVGFGAADSVLQGLIEALGAMGLSSAEDSGSDGKVIVTCDLHRHLEVIPEIRRRIAGNPESIVLSVGYPGEATLLPEAKRVLATFSAAPASLRAAAAVLAGRAKPEGQMPVGT